jgi:hypothetical protein
MNMKDIAGSINEALLMEKLGPAPKVSTVSAFLVESIPTTWRRVRDGQLQALPGEGTIRISLRSLATFLNKGSTYEPTHKRGRKPAEAAK